ncbi:hypothetical protein SAMN04487972_102280 [Paracoccus halophilus]|uniref:Uncharacterized protein n=1 Tax=Paracoccus halophilus TaxID=376733 RepID=A0A1I0SRZ5_9RHOB|nr:hypothetical protein SAMN04487972_102280 [Paracoccus halophilus]
MRDCSDSPNHLLRDFGPVSIGIITTASVRTCRNALISFHDTSGGGPDRGRRRRSDWRSGRAEAEHALRPSRIFSIAYRTRLPRTPRDFRGHGTSAAKPLKGNITVPYKICGPKGPRFPSEICQCAVPASVSESCAANRRMFLPGPDRSRFQGARRGRGRSSVPSLLAPRGSRHVSRPYSLRMPRLRRGCAPRRRLALSPLPDILCFGRAFGPAAATARPPDQEATR